MNDADSLGRDSVTLALSNTSLLVATTGHSANHNANALQSRPRHEDVEMEDIETPDAFISLPVPMSVDDAKISPPRAAKPIPNVSTPDTNDADSVASRLDVNADMLRHRNPPNSDGEDEVGDDSSDTDESDGEDDEECDKDTVPLSSRVKLSRSKKSTKVHTRKSTRNKIKPTAQAHKRPLTSLKEMPTPITALRGARGAQVKDKGVKNSKTTREIPPYSFTWNAVNFEYRAKDPVFDKPMWISTESDVVVRL